MNKHTAKWSCALLALYALTASALPYRRSYGQDLPVCIVGAGPAGLSAASKLQDKGIKAIVFDKQDAVGGKCQAYYDDQGIFHPLGAAFFSNATYPDTIGILNQTNVSIQPFALAGARDMFRYNFSDGDIAMNPPFPPQFLATVAAEVPRYISIWAQRFAPISAANYKNGVPEEFTVTGRQWFINNNFTALPTLLVDPVAWYGYGDINIVPALYILQYMTPDILTGFLGIHEVYYMDFHKMWVEYSQNKLCETTILTSAEVRCIDRSGDNPVVSYTVPNNGSYVNWQKQECSSVILAFPPTIENLERAGLDMTEQEHNTFNNVTVHQYSSSADVFDLPYGVSYVANSTAVSYPPPNDGQVIAVLRLTNDTGICTAWQWGSYEYQTEEVTKQLLIDSLSEINKDPRNATEAPEPFCENDVKAFTKWNDYFPHFGTDALAGGAYAALNTLQGQKKTYYASGLAGMEIVEWAIRGGYEVVNDYF